MAHKITIFGSCVSRDVFNYKHQGIELIGYFARSSMASAFAEKMVADKYSHNLHSDFQRRMVEADLGKRFRDHLKYCDYDLLLIDLIDERFNLFAFDNGGVCTLSNELLAAGFEAEHELGHIVLSGSDEFYALWENAWIRFLSEIDAIGRRHKIVINKVFWAKTTSSGNGFKTHTKSQILAANELLGRLYARMARDLEAWQFIEAGSNFLLAAEDHRWGVSPFHYIGGYYRAFLKKMYEFLCNSSVLGGASGPSDNFANENLEFLTQDVEYPFDRHLLSWVRFSAFGCYDDLKLSVCRTSGNAVVRHEEKSSVAIFNSGPGAHQVSFILPDKYRANGLAAKIRLCNWSSIRYLAFGYTCQAGFRHIKVVNPPQDQWFTVSLVHGSIAYGIQNDWDHPPATEIPDVRIYLKGEPLSGGGVEVEHFICWEEADRPVTTRTTCTLPLMLPPTKLVSEDLLNALYGYLRKCFRHVEKQAKSLMQDGQCPLYGEVQLDWPLDQVLPDMLSTVGTYAFSWHSLHPASILMVYAKDTGNDAAVFAAREMVTNWLDHNYYAPTSDKKYAWYDHGTAERQMAFILMWAEGVRRGFDQRFMSRLGGVILRHAELLESEQFYASHQPTRYHNHAWFQDLALMATALAIPDAPAATRWMRRAIERLSDQFERLIVRDNGFAVFVENSIGYHQGVQRVVELVGELVKLGGIESTISDVAVELSCFSDFFRYPDSRAPAQGDTFRRSNRFGDEARRMFKPYSKPEAVILPKAGYGIVKGNHDGVPFMFCMFATSKSKTHKHEDDLSFTFFFDGIEWLIDPSFFSHEYKSSIPAYLRSAAAHNSLFIPDMHYSIEPGHSKLSGIITGEKFEFFGEHWCYESAIVKRIVRGSCSEVYFEFEDEVVSPVSSGPEPRVMMHCGEGVEVSLDEAKLTLVHPNSKYQINVELQSKEILIHKGLCDGKIIRGLSGTSFMAKTDIYTIEALIPFNRQINWRLSVKSL